MIVAVILLGIAVITVTGATRARNHDRSHPCPTRAGDSGHHARIKRILNQRHQLVGMCRLRHEMLKTFADTA